METIQNWQKYYDIVLISAKQQKCNPVGNAGSREHLLSTVNAPLIWSVAKYNKIIYKCYVIIVIQLEDTFQINQAKDWSYSKIRTSVSQPF